MFDPYLDWLGITDERRPPTLYQILGLRPETADTRSIDAAANQQLTKVQKYLTGATAKDAWQLVDEITLAKTTLLDPAKRSAYDGIFGIGPRSAPPTQPPPAPAAASAGWGQYMPTANVAPPARSSPPPAPAAPIVPSVSFPVHEYAAPAPFNPLQDNESPASDELPSSSTITRPSVRRSGGNGLLIAAGVGACALIGVIVFVVTRGGNGSPTPEEKKHPAEVVDASIDVKHPETLTKHDKDPNVKIDLPKDPPKKIVKKKDPPKNDPPPKVEIAEEFKEATIYRGHAVTPRTLAVSPDGKQLLSGGGDGAIFSWVPNSDKPSRRKTIPDAMPAVGVGFLHKGKEAIAVDSATIYVIDLATNAERMKIPTPGGSYTSLAVTADGEHFATGHQNGQVRWWEAGKEAPEKTITASMSVPIDCLALTPDGKYLAAGNRSDGGLSVWNLGAGTQVKQWKAHDSDVTAIVSSPDGKRIATSGADKLVKVWDILSGSLLLTLKGHEDVPLALLFTADSTMIISAGVDSTIRSWDAVTGELMGWGNKGEHRVFALAIDPKDRFVIAGQNDGGLQMLFLPAVRPDSIPKSLWTLPKSVQPKPEAGEIATALQEIRTKYATDFARTEPKEQRALYEKLRARADHGNDNAPTRFALFQESRDLAAKADSIEDSFKAVTAAARWFLIDDLEEKAAALKQAAAGSVGKSTVAAAISVVEEADKQSRSDIVDELMRQRELFPQTPLAAEFNIRIQAAEKRWSNNAAEREANRKLASDLKQKPDDPALNAQLGKYLCFRADDWAEGLPRLAKGDDVVLRDLAKKEAADPKDAKDQLELGKAWLDYAPKADEFSRAGILLRAKLWHEKAIPNLPVNEKLPIGVRVGEINKQLRALGSNNLPQSVTRRNFNSIRSAAAFNSEWEAVGADGVDAEGVRLKPDGSLASRFKMLDGCRIDFRLVLSGQALNVDVNGGIAKFTPAASPTFFTLSVERKKDEVVLIMKDAKGAVLESKNVKLSSAPPVAVSLKLSSTGPLLLQRIIINGPAKPTE